MSRNAPSPATDLAAFRDGQPMLQEVIKQHLDERLSMYAETMDRAAYIKAAHTLPDSATEYFCVLANAGVAEHHWLWLHVIERLARICGMLLKHSLLHAASNDAHLSNATTVLAPVLQHVARHAETFFNAANAAFLTANGASRAHFGACLISVSGLFIAGQPPVRGIHLFEAAVDALVRYFRVAEVSPPPELHQCRLAMATPLMTLARAAYMSGMSQAVLPLLFLSSGKEAPVSETFLPLMVLDPAVSLALVTDFYRYFAFCLVTTVAEAPDLDGTVVSKADIFLHVLLALPHLHLANYTSGMSETGAVAVPSTGYTRLVSPTEREEIAFYFLLNSLFHVRSLPELAAPHAAFARERRFFISSFNRRCGAELDVSASLSRTSSVVSMPRIAEAAVQSAALASVTLSSVLADGTYKEKVRLVAEFFNLAGNVGRLGAVKRLVETFDMSGMLHRAGNPGSAALDVLRIVRRIDPLQYPGKILYVKALDKIVRLSQLVSLKHFVPVFGDSLRPLELLGRLFKTNYLLRDILLVKDLLHIDANDIISIQYRMPASEHDLLLKQFRLLKTTRLLKTDVQKLI